MKKRPATGDQGTPRGNEVANRPHSAKMSPEEHEKALNRLYDQSLKVILKRNEAYKEELSKTIKRTQSVSPAALKYHNEAAEKSLYSDAIRRKKENARKLDVKYSHDNEMRRLRSELHLKEQLTVEEQQEMGDRLCGKYLERKKRELKDLDAKVYGNPKSEKKLTKKELKDCANRLCTESLRHKQESIQKLEGKYLWKRDVGKKLDASEYQQIFSRLAKKEH